METKKILEGIEHFVIGLYQEAKTDEPAFHNLPHLREVLNATQNMALHYQKDDEETFMLTSAAWFIGAGYLSRGKRNEKSITIAKSFLKNEAVPKAIIRQVIRCITAAKGSAKPFGLLEYISHDANSLYVASARFSALNRQRKEELFASRKRKISDADWTLKSIRLLENHRFYTDYCQKRFELQKQNNIAELKNAAPDTSEGKTKKAGNGTTEKSGEKNISETAPGSVDYHHRERAERGIQTLFKMVTGNNQRLSSMADNKSHILITVNSIIISAIFTVVIRKADSDDYTRIPAFMMMLTSTISIIVSIIATRPRVHHGKITSSDSGYRYADLLSFGTYFKTDIDTYVLGMQNLINDSDLLYEALIQYMHAQGIVIGKKYDLLRLAYTLFMYGLVLSVLTCILLFYITGNQARPPAAT
ncbi:MAG TPA: Pycsar system effector family protein [Mucilaginibacter sp.]|jgi:hypothetical protein